MQFKDLKSLQKHVEEIAPIYLTGSSVGDVLAKTMRNSVKEVVYKPRKPKKYKRRKNDGGLSDMRNMQWTSFSVKDGVLSLVFENLTTGQTHQIPIYDNPVDSMEGQYITDLIEEGAVGGSGEWYDYSGEWIAPRPFVADAIKKLKSNPAPLQEGIKKAFRKAGFKTK